MPAVANASRNAVGRSIVIVSPTAIAVAPPSSVASLTSCASAVRDDVQALAVTMWSKRLLPTVRLQVSPAAAVPPSVTVPWVNSSSVPPLVARGLAAGHDRRAEGVVRRLR